MRSVGVEEVELRQVLDHLLLDQALEIDVEILERLAGGKAGGVAAHLAAVRLARRQLGREEKLGEALG
jgi:hypothetical protein